MKTKDECLLEAQSHFGVKVFANDDGITRRIEHHAMELFANQKNANLTNLYKIEVEANEKLRRLHQQSEEQNAQLRKENEELRKGLMLNGLVPNSKDAEITRLTELLREAYKENVLSATTQLKIENAIGDPSGPHAMGPGH